MILLYTVYSRRSYGKKNAVPDDDLIAKCRRENGIRAIGALIDHWIGVPM
jgi:Iap family predicted aminopeptidase